MRRILLFFVAVFFIEGISAQNISVRVRQVSYSAIDPDGAGPAVGSVTYRFELKSSGTSVLADGMGLSVVYQSSKLLATPTNTTLKLGPINTALWAQGADNRPGLVIAPVTYGSRSFDRRMIVSFNQNSGVPDALISGTVWTPVAQITYYTLGTVAPEGGYITPEPATTVAQNELSSDGGLTTYPYLSPELNTPVPLSSTGAPLPVLFTKFDAQCQPDKSTTVTWTTSQEVNNSYFELERTSDGVNWNAISKVLAGGNSPAQKNYQVNDPQGGTVQYRIKQVDGDGKVNYSAIVKTACSGRNIYVTFYPIPARDVVNLLVGSDKNVKTALQVYDSKGRCVLNMAATITIGVNNFKIPVLNLAAGEYFIKGTSTELEISKRFIIVR